MFDYDTPAVDLANTARPHRVVSCRWLAQDAAQDMCVLFAASLPFTASTTLALLAVRPPLVLR